jgi:hypothetical protein
MARDLSVVLSDLSGNVLAEGRIVRKEQSEAYGLVVHTDDPSAEVIPLPFIKKMALSQKESK